jgi:hypothetical protein
MWFAPGLCEHMSVFALQDELGDLTSVDEIMLEQFEQALFEAILFSESSSEDHRTL